MVTIGKLGKGQETYYLDSVGGGAEDYYSGEGEALGRWTGSGASELGLEGTVGRDDLHAVLAGRDPRTDLPLLRLLRKDRVPGFDVTFSAPKSVSVLWATGDERTARLIRDAHERSVEAALGFLEREAAFTRLGTDGQTAARGSGFVAAAFRHRMSRAGDPQLHTHVLVGNLIKTSDGKWRTLDGQRLYRRAKTAGYLYQAHLRDELSRQLGVSWREVHRGAAEVAGVPDETLRAFSRRRREIEARMAERGGSSRRSAEIAALETRKREDYGVRPAEQRSAWRERASASGLDLDAVMRRRSPPERLGEATVFARVESKLTAERGTFARRDVVEEIAAAHRQGASVDRVERLADRFLARAHVVELGEARPTNARRFAPSEPLYTTRDVLALEERLVQAAAHRSRETPAVARPKPVEAALARDPALTDEQRAMVRRLARGGEATVCVVGRAGAGKTRALRPMREALQADGVEVIGASLQNTAARILEEEAGIRSTSLARLLYEADVQGFGLPRGGVVVVDEAAMASTRALARLQDLAVRDRTKLILIGDPEQLPAIEHPGAFRALVDRLGAIELTEVRRLRDPVERAAVELVRSGRGSSALAAYSERGQLTLATVSDLEEVVVGDRQAAQRAGATAIILCRTRARTARLNELAQGLRLAEGELGEVSIDVGEGRIHEGDHVVTRVNRGGHAPVHNRERWGVAAIDPEARQMTLRHLVETERLVILDADYLDRRPANAVGSVELGYAITKYGAQGMTVDRAFVVLGDGLSKEEAYTALTRAREGTELYAVSREPVERAEIAPAKDERTLGPDKLGRGMERSEQRALAIDERLRGKLEGRSTEELVRELDRLEAARDDPATRRAETTAAARREAEAQLAEAHRALESPRARGRERARLEAIHEHAAERVDALRTQERAAREAAPDPADPRRPAAIERVLAERRRLSIEAAIMAEPRYLTEAIGPRPAGLRSRLGWERAADSVERHRQRFGVRDPDRALGDEPRARDERARWRAAQRELEAARVRLVERERASERVRVAGQGIER